MKCYQNNIDVTDKIIDWAKKAERLESVEKEVDLLLQKLEEANKEITKRGHIIAEKILGWRRYTVNSGQEVYAPDQETADNLCVGSSLNKLIDEEIESMQSEIEDV